MGIFFDSCLLNLLSVLTALVAVVYAYTQWSFQYWKRRNVPYFEPVFPWGTLGNPFKRPVSMAESVASIYNKAKSKGWKYLGMYSFTKTTFLVMDLDLVKQVMTKDFHNFTDRGMYTNEKDDPLSCHLFAIGGKKWRNLRTKLSPTFTSGKMKSMFSTLVECSQGLERYVQEHINNEEGMDIKDILGKFSTDVIGSCAFGLECNSFKDENSPFRIYGKKIFERSITGVVKFVMATNFPGFSKAIRITTIPKDISDFMRKVVKDTVSYRLENNYNRNDFLQLLIDIMNDEAAIKEGYKGDGKTLTMDEATAQCFVFFLAGFETSSTTMTFALYELARHQDIQDVVRIEITTILAKYNGQMTYESLSEMKYLKQVIDETLRLYCPVPFVTRMCAEDYKIPDEDVVIEKGTKLMIPIFAIHRDPEYYENPTEFNPGRFSEENKTSRHQYAHIPFGEGPRICIGERFGLMQTKVGLISILKNYQVTLNKKTDQPMKFSTRNFIPTAQSGVWINLEKI